ncbi:MAG: metallophosphatase [Clostridia bacterium]|jgi:hypothetical protein|nr:metallophosphatase [Clostridia bacterium]
MIYITGDTHSDFSRFTKENFQIQSEMTKDDYIIICGGFGGVWTFEEESSREKERLDWLDNKNFTTLFVDENHENYTRLYNYPIEEWKGGKVHKIRDSVLHLMRGEIFDIDNKKIFAFGGAKSHDIQDGIFNLDEEEIQNGISNLEKVNYKVDYVISHCCPTSIQTLINPTYKRDILTDYLQQISEKCTFKRRFVSIEKMVVQYNSIANKK